MKILFVDDDKFFMQPYVDVFIAQPNSLTVNIVNTAVKAQNILSEIENVGYDCLVFDVMMPPPPGWEARTEDGKFTGTELVKEYQDIIVAIGLPVLILSNIGVAALTTRVNSLGLSRHLIEVRSKILTPPADAKALVLELIARRDV